MWKESSEFRLFDKAVQIKPKLRQEMPRQFVFRSEPKVSKMLDFFLSYIQGKVDHIKKKTKLLWIVI